MKNTKESIRDLNLPSLPEDVLLIEILERLPVKSLLRFKCVCKNWYNLIESPYFISNHFNNPNNHTRLLVRHRTSPINPNSDLNWDTDSDSDDYYIPQNPLAVAIFPDETLEVCPLVHEDIIDFIQKCPRFHQIHIIGPVNGLFLLHAGFCGTNDRLALWNPARKGFRQLPTPKFTFPKDEHEPPRSHVFGFGLDPLTKDYKVVWIPTFFPEEPPDLATTVLYTLAGDESWRRIVNPSVLASVHGIWWRCSYDFMDCVEYFSGEYLNGAFYWLVECRCGRKIVLFDMGKDVFREIMTPNDIKAKRKGLNLVVHDDLIGLLEMEYMSPDVLRDLKSVHLWVMRQEGCWTKHFTLGFGPQTRILQALGFWKSDKEIFFETTSNRLVLGNLNTRTVTHLGVCGDETASFLQVFKYKESLVSVKGGQTENQNKGKLGDFIRDFFDVYYEDD